MSLRNLLLGTVFTLAPAVGHAAAALPPLRDPSPLWSLGIGFAVMAAAGGAALGLAASEGIREMVLRSPQEAYLSDILQFDALAPDNKTIITKDGCLVQTVELAGLDFGGLDRRELEAEFVRRKSWYETLTNSGIIIRIISDRDRADVDMGAEYDNQYLQDVHDAWMRNFRRVYETRHYLVFSIKGRGQAALSQLNEAVRQSCDFLNRYGPRVLDNGEQDYSPLLTFWAGMVNGWRHKVGSFAERLSEQLVSDVVEFDATTGRITYRDGVRERYGAVVSVTAWGNRTRAQIRQRILALAGSVTVFQYVRSMPKFNAVYNLRQRVKQATLLIKNYLVEDQFEEAINKIDAGQEAFFEHQMSVFLKADTPEELEALIDAVRRIMADDGVRPAVETAAAEWLWRCRLPGFDKMVRVGNLYSSHLAQLVTFDSVPKGLGRSVYGEGAVRLFRTAEGGPYQFQFHVSDAREALGHFIAIAPPGEGKTTLAQHLIGGALRHRRLRAYAFDRFHGMKIFTHAAGGAHIDLATREEGGRSAVKLNPLQQEDTQFNRLWLHQWLQQISGAYGKGEEKAASRAVDAIFSVADKRRRSLASVYETAFETGTALRDGISNWLPGEILGDWFNGDVDSLALGESRLVTFEMTTVFANEQLVPAMVSYIMHRIRSVVRDEKLPHLIWIDEAAPLLKDRGFRENVEILYKEHRKLLGVVGMAFQNAGDIAKSGIAETVLNNAPTAFFFRNPKATVEDYAPWRLTEDQFGFILGTSQAARGLPHAVLVKRGDEAVILDISLKPLGPLLRAYASGSNSLLLFESMRKTWGEQWLAPYLQEP